MDVNLSTALKTTLYVFAYKIIMLYIFVKNSKPTPNPKTAKLVVRCFKNMIYKLQQLP